MYSFINEITNSSHDNKPKDTTIDNAYKHHPNSTSLLIRPLQEHDRDPLQQLHEEIFPVKYTDEFYDNAVRNKSMSGHPIYSRVIVKLDDDCTGNQTFAPMDDTQYLSLKPSPDIGGPSSSSCCCSSFMEELARDVDMDPKIFQNIKIEERIHVSHHKDNAQLSSIQNEIENGEVERGINCLVGCIIGGFFHVKHIKDEKIRGKLIRSDTRHSRMFYIMTLGTTQSFRKHKLGTKLVKDCLQMVQQVPSCGVVYLHVITYNQAAIQFYETLGFHRIEEIQGMYSLID
jgi:ribosomal protein S18 acetylase RimI-like enzyme